jgi:AcrR family transcriptional regulator
MMQMDKTKASIIKAGMDLWRDGSETDVSSRKIAATIGISHAAVLYWFTSASEMRDVIANAAVVLNDPIIVPKLIVARHPAVANMPAEKRQLYLAGC